MRNLGLNKKGKVLVTTDGSKVIVEPVRDLLELSGSLKTNKKPLSSRQLHEKFADYLAEQALGQNHFFPKLS